VKKITPFANEADSVGIGDLTVENRLDRVSIYGSLDLTRDKQGLKNARALKELVDNVVRVLESDKKLPDKLPPPKAPGRVKNPFQ